MEIKKIISILWELPKQSFLHIINPNLKKGYVVKLIIML